MGPPPPAHLVARQARANILWLDGLRAAIHREYLDGFTQEFPLVKLVGNVFVADEKFVTASGGSAAADLMLHLIERDQGYDLSVAVADQMVYNAVRSSQGAAASFGPAAQGIRNAHLIRALEMMQARIDDPCSRAEVAPMLGIYTRQLERLFSLHLDTSPK